MKNLGRTQRHAGGNLLGRAAAELERLKTENERMRAVVEAARKFDVEKRRHEVDSGAPFEPLRQATLDLRIAIRALDSSREGETK